MKYVDEFRDAKLVKNLVKEISNKVTQPWSIMEICGGQTHSIMKYGLMDLLPEEITLIHGPGCPVCVTPVEMIDKAIYLATDKNVILVSFGDMLRVPGSKTDLLSAKAGGADVRTVLSPLETLKIARENPGRKVVFFAVGFETTAPVIALMLVQAKKQKIANVFVLISHVLVPPAMEAILGSPDNKIQGFLAAGHVCTVMGVNEYKPIAKKYNIPIVVTGFEPIDILAGIARLVDRLEAKQHVVENAYKRVVRDEGNKAAQQTLWEVFEPANQKWRGIGEIPSSGLKLKSGYAAFNIENKLDLTAVITEESGICIAGEILTGQKKPFECPAFGKLCTPEKPLGAPMVSSEGACAAYYRYANNEIKL
jgi:hydrogenase expression/formation protein HypD